MRRTMDDHPVSRHFRAPSEGEQRATNLELFFDLVFVFAITQLAHVLVTHETWIGAAQATFLLLAVWWAWTYTTWMTNWFDPDSLPVRAILILLMLLGLFMAIAIPEAFGSRGLLFAGSYVALQVARNAFNVWSAKTGTAEHGSFLRILIWSIWTGAIWVAAPLIGGDLLVPIWGLALIADLAGPFCGYWAPVLGRSQTTDWYIEGSHFAERFQLFVLISLGEGIVVVGITARDAAMTPIRAASIVVAFLISAALWWLYFNFVAQRAQERLRTAENAGALARDAFTYIHVIIVMGMIVTAVADEILISHPNEAYHVPLIAVAGPVLYLIGHNFFRMRMVGTFSRVRLVGALALLALIPFVHSLPALGTESIVLGVLLAVIVREHFMPTPAPLSAVLEGVEPDGHPDS